MRRFWAALSTLVVIVLFSSKAFSQTPTPSPAPDSITCRKAVRACEIQNSRRDKGDIKWDKLRVRLQQDQGMKTIVLARYDRSLQAVIERITALIAEIEALAAPCNAVSILPSGPLRREAMRSCALRTKKKREQQVRIKQVRIIAARRRAAEVKWDKKLARDQANIDAWDLEYQRIVSDRDAVCLRMSDLGCSPF